MNQLVGRTEGLSAAVLPLLLALACGRSAPPPARPASPAPEPRQAPPPAQEQAQEHEQSRELPIREQPLGVLDELARTHGGVFLRVNDRGKPRCQHWRFGMGMLVMEEGETLVERFHEIRGDSIRLGQTNVMSLDSGFTTHDVNTYFVVAVEQDALLVVEVEQVDGTTSKPTYRESSEERWYLSRKACTAFPTSTRPSRSADSYLRSLP